MVALRRALFAGLAAAFVAAGAAAQPLTVVGGNSFPPLMYDDGGARGYAIEIAKAIATDAGFTVKAETYPWPRAQKVALDEGAVITGFSFNEERAKNYHYTRVAFKDPVVVVTTKNSPLAFSKAADLAGKSVGMPRGASFGPAFEAIRGQLKIEEDDRDEQRLRKLATGRIDAALFTGGIAALNYVAAKFAVDTSEFKMFEASLVEDDIFLAVGKSTPGAEAIVARLNASIAKLTADGTIAKLLK